MERENFYISALLFPLDLQRSYGLVFDWSRSQNCNLESDSLWTKLAMVAVIFFFCLFTCMLRYQVNYLAIAAYAIVSSARIHLLQGVRLFFFWTNDKRKIFESLISPRWAILEMLRKSGRKRSQPRSVATSWTERRRWFIYVLEMLLSACSMPRSLVTWT